MLDSGRLFTGGLLLLAGVLLLLNNIGAIGWGLWLNLLSLWPLLLVALGLRLIFRRGPLAVLSPLVLVLMVVWAAAMPTEYLLGNDTATFRQAFDESVKEATLIIGTGAVDLRVRGGESVSGDLISVSERWYGRPTAWSHDRVGSRAILRATRSFESIVGFPFAIKGSANRMEVDLNPSVPWTIEVNTGAASVDLNLSEIEVRELKIGSGASRIDIVLGSKADDVAVDIGAGFAAVNLTVPRGIGVTIDKDSALSGDNFAAMGFTKQGDVWYSPGYDTASERIRVDFDGGFSSFNVRFSGPPGVSL